MTTEQFYADNRANWDDRARVHAESEMYSLEEYATNPNRVSGEDVTYSDNPAGLRITHTRQHEWNHSLSDVINALVGVGMRIDRLDEHQGVPWPFAPSAVQDGNL